VEALRCRAVLEDQKIIDMNKIILSIFLVSIFIFSLYCLTKSFMPLHPESPFVLQFRVHVPQLITSVFGIAIGVLCLVKYRDKRDAGTKGDRPL